MALIDFVRYDGGPNVFAWKFPNTELSTATQCVVNESQEAVFFKGGQALDVLGPGRHTLSSANIPIIGNLFKLPFGGNSPFQVEVWYTNKAHSLDIKWGTATAIQLKDPMYKIFVPVRSNGQFGIQINESKMFLTKLVGTMSVFDKTNVVNFFRGLYITKVKDSIASYVIKKGISFLEINAYLDELSEHMKERIKPTMDEYGISLVNFYVNDISVPEDDPAVIKLKEALAKKAEMDIIGYSYAQERSFDTLEGAATNQGAASSGLMGAGMGLGMGAGIGGPMGAHMGGLVQNINTKELKKCSDCNAEMEKTARFCPVCGFDTLKSQTEVRTTEAVTKKPSDSIICTECGSVIPKNSKFCTQCADSVDPCPFCGADIKKGSLACHECGKELPKNCPKCGTPITNKNAKFCPECAVPLIKKCKKCGTEIIGTPKFCPECAEPINN